MRKRLFQLELHKTNLTMQPTERHLKEGELPTATLQRQALDPATETASAALRADQMQRDQAAASHCCAGPGYGRGRESQ